MTPQRVTVSTLKKLGACENAVLLAQTDARLRNGGLAPAVFLHVIPRGDWLIWWLWNSRQATVEQCVILACVGGQRSLRFASEQDRAMLIAAFNAADAVTINNTEETRSAAAAMAQSAESAAARLAAESAAESAAARSAAAAYTKYAAELIRLLKAERREKKR